MTKTSKWKTDVKRSPHKKAYGAYWETSLVPVGSECIQEIFLIRDSSQNCTS